MVRRRITKRSLDDRLAARQQLPPFGLWQTAVGPIDIALARVATDALTLFAHLAAKARGALLARMADRRFGAIDHLPALVRLDRLTLQYVPGRADAVVDLGDIRELRAGVGLRVRCRVVLMRNTGGMPCS